MTLCVLVSLGTDHHRFDRLVDWLEEWAGTRPGEVRVVLQHGHSRPSELAENSDIVSREDVLSMMRSADVVITQAGPGSMFDAHESGHLPIVVARRHELGEVVDDHQVFFADLMERLGDCLVARDRSQLHAYLDQALIDATFLRRPLRPSAAEQTAIEVRRRLDVAIEQGPGWLVPRRLAEALRRRRSPDPGTVKVPVVLPTGPAVTTLPPAASLSPPEPRPALLISAQAYSPTVACVNPAPSRPADLSLRSPRRPAPALILPAPRSEAGGAP